jgi:hypothetical protein
MRHPYYYLIQATDNLREAVAHLDADSREFWCRPIMWSKGESDRSVYSATDHLAELKIVFVAYLFAEYSHLDEFQEVFGELPINLNSFDKWWSVNRYSVEDDFDLVLRGISASILEKFEATGHPAVDCSINSIKRMKTSS